jgi:hypothetical protein
MTVAIQQPNRGADLLFEAVAQLGWGETKPPFVPPPVVPVEHRDEQYARRAAAWCEKALAGRCERLAAETEGGRNHALNKHAYILLRYVIAGHLDVETVVEKLRDAALECGLGWGEIEATLGSAQRAAQRDGPAEPPLGQPSDDTLFAKLEIDPATGEVKPALTPEELRERAHARRVVEELLTLRARDEAKRLYAAERAAQTFREPPSRRTLTDELLLPDEPVRYAVDKLLPVGGNALLTAQYKAGKTTCISNLARSFADDEPFLGRFEMSPTRAGRMAIWNYELGESQYRAWLRQLGIKNTDAISVLHLRGYRLPLTASAIEDWIVEWLREHEVTFWIADPFARAAVGVDENSNTEVGVWLDTFDVIKERAGVSEAVLSVHTGRMEQESGKERARGATRLDDWADVRWLLTIDDEGQRYFRATGRDVDVDEEKLTFSENDRRLLMGGGNRSWEKRRKLEDVVVAFVRSHPGATGRAVELGVEGKSAEIRSALRGAVIGHRLRVEEGDKNARHHFSND